MQTKSILMALSAMALVTACTNDETIEMNRGEGISLSAVAGKATRAGSEATRQIVLITSMCTPLHKDWSI